MKKFFVLLLALIALANVSAQESTKVTMKLTYKGAPLCFWDVKLKHGDVVLKEGKTDDEGFVDFGYVRLLSQGVDASGYKKTANGDKSWDVKGYMAVNDNGHVDFDFLPLVEETGMGSMMEAAWGLTLNDCASSGSNSTTTVDNTSASGGTTTTGETEEKTEYQPVTVDPAVGYQNQRDLYANKISDLDRKITKKNEELAGVKADSKDYNDLSYEIKDLEIERQIAQLKLEKTDKEIANNYAPLDKTQRDYYKNREDELKQEQKTLKEKRDSGVRIGNEDGSGSAEIPEGEEEFEKFTVYTAEELAAMSTVSLQKLKMEYQARCGKRKAAIKTKSAIMKPAKIELIQTEIAELEKMILMMETELARRKD